MANLEPSLFGRSPTIPGPVLRAEGVLCGASEALRAEEG